jgi:hypothetical protein
VCRQARHGSSAALRHGRHVRYSAAERTAGLRAAGGRGFRRAEATMVAKATVGGAATRRGSRRAWHATGRFVRVAALGMAAAAVLAWDVGRRGVTTAASVGRRTARRAAGVAATDARHVAGSAVAAGRRLRPRPETFPGGPDDVLPPPPGLEPGLGTGPGAEPEPVPDAAAIAVLAPLRGTDARRRGVRTGTGPGRADHAGHAPAAFAPATPEAAPKGLSDVELGVLAEAGLLDAATEVLVQVGTDVGTETLPASRTDVLPEVAPEAPPAVEPDAQPRHQPVPVADVLPAPSVRRRRPRDGVIVPLRVPFLTRLRAIAGLVVMVVVLGATMAIIVAGLALAGAQALDRF